MVNMDEGSDKASVTASAYSSASKLHDNFGIELSYTAFEQWIKKDIKVRECCVFIKKSDGELEPICHCGNVRSAHVEGIQILGEMEKWDKTTHTTLTECTAYGKINFLDEDTTIQPEFIRVASDYGDRKNIQRMERLFREFWNLTPPGLLISVIGGAKSFNVSHDICEHFKQGLLNAAKSTNGWIVTGGQDEGVTKLVGDIIGRSIFTAKIYTIGVASWGKTWNSEMLLRKNRNMHSDVVLDYTTSDPDPSFAALEPNHSHFFLVDDGTTDNSGVELKFRGELEFLITKMFEKDGVPLPMICIMLEGGYQSIDMALNTLRLGQPLVVIKGSGRAADIICHACELTVTKEEFVGGQFTQKGYVPEENKRELQDMLEACFSKYKESGMIEKLLAAVLEIASLKKSVTIYRVDGPEPLDFAILSSLMKSIGESAARMRQMKLAITWGHEKVAKELIFEKKDYKFKTDELNSLLFFSIVNRRVGFVKLLLDHGADLKNFLTAPTLTKLYNILPKNSGAYRLLHRVDRAISLRDIGQLIERIMEGTYHSILTQEAYNQDMCEDDRFDNPYDLMVVYAALVDAYEMSRFFWEGSRTPIATALICYKIFLFLDKMESRWARIDEEMTEKLETSAREFEKLATGLMTTCYHNYEKQDWVQILVVPLKEWGSLNLFDLATIIDAKNFISHAAYQSYLTDIWMGQIKPSTSAFKLLICMVPPLPALLKYNKVPMSKQDLAKKMIRGKDLPAKRRKVNEADVEFAPRANANGTSDENNMRTPTFKEKLYYFYTSPVIKFFFNTGTYLIFLILYGYGLLVANPKMVINKEGSRLEWQDLYTIVFVASTVPVEFMQIRNTRTKDNWKKVKDHFSDLYNLMDFFATLMFCVAFCLKAATPYNNSHSIMDLNNYSTYHVYRTLSSMCFMFYCFRFVQMFEINDQIGPKLFMLKKMAIDLFFFLFLLLVFTVSYGVSSQALLYPFRESSFSEVIFEFFQRSYLNVFGEIGLDDFNTYLKTGHCEGFGEGSWTLTHSKGNFNTSSTACSSQNLIEHTIVGKVNYYLAFTLLCGYLLFVNIMLINLLIAIFSNTYAEVEAQSGIIYKTQRASMILEFRLRPPLPNPISLLYFLGKLIRSVYRKYFRKHNYEKDLTILMSSMPSGRNSSIAYRSSLMEAECRAQFIRKHKTEMGNPVISHMNRQYTDLVSKITKLDNSLNTANERIAELAESNASKLRSTVGPAVEGWKSIFQHKFSLTTPYPGTDIQRYPLTNECIPWRHTYPEYNPPEYTNDDLPHLDNTPVTTVTESEEASYLFYVGKDGADPYTFDTLKQTTNKIKFNVIDEGGVDRISFVGKYPVIDHYPINPKGRTGLTGRGGLPRWGPNHLAVSVVSRFSKSEATSAINLIEEKPVCEILLVKMVDTDYWVFPQGFCAPKEPMKHSQQRVILDLCYDYGNLTRQEQKPLLTSLDSAFKQQKELMKAYFDDAMNTDNAWIEVCAGSLHDSNNHMLATFQPGRGVAEVAWVKVDQRIKMKTNMVWLMKKALTAILVYNPYKGDVITT